MVEVDAKVMTAVIASLAVVIAGSGLILFIADENSTVTVLNIDHEGIFENGSYREVIVSAAVGDGHVVLRNIMILESLIIRGGGQNSVVLDGCTNEGSTVVDKQGGEDVRVYLRNTVLPTLEAQSNIILEADSDAGFVNVSLNCASTTVKGSDTSISNMVVSDSVSLDMQAGTVSDLLVPENASVNISSGGNAKVNSVTVGGIMNVNGITTQIDKVSLRDGSSLNVSEGTVDAVDVPENASVSLSSGAEGKIVTADVKDGSSLNVSGSATSIGKIDMKDGSSLNLKEGSVALVEIPTGSTVNIDKKTEGNIGSAIVGDNVSIDSPEGSDIENVKFIPAEGSSGKSLRVHGNFHGVTNPGQHGYPGYPWFPWFSEWWQNWLSYWYGSP